MEWYPRQDSNLRARFRKPMLYPLSYGGTHSESTRFGPHRASHWGCATFCWRLSREVYPSASYGSASVKVAPWPGVLLRLNVPPRRIAIVLERYRPSPRPLVPSVPLVRPR